MSSILTKEKIRSKLPVLAALLLFLLVYSILHLKFHHHYSVYFQFFDYIFGMIGFGFLIFELWAIKSSTEAAERAIYSTHQTMSESRQIFNVGSSTSLTKQIIASNRDRKFELSVDRLQELRRQLIHLEKHDSQNNLGDRKKLSKMASQISIHLSLIEEKIPDDEESLDAKFLNSLMNEVLTLLNTIEAKTSIKIPNI